VLTRRDEILVSRLIGATDRYIRRPFLYLGALQGLLGGWLQAAYWPLLAPYCTHRSSAWRTLRIDISPAAPTWLEIACVLGMTTLFGWVGAWISVTARCSRLKRHANFPCSTEPLIGLALIYREC